MAQWHDFPNLKHQWSEDDASLAAGDESREQIRGAWKRLFSEDFPGINSALAREDGGDCILYLFENNRVLMNSHDGDHIYLTSSGETPASSNSNVDNVDMDTDEDEDDEEMSDDQAIALDDLFAAVDEGQRILLLEGAAGTGKTWLMKKFAARAKSLGWAIQYMAPTGQAAHKLSKTVGEEAKTIHSALYSKVLDGDNGEPIFADPKPLTERAVRTFIICDESSMVDEYLHRDIIANLPVNCVLLYVGDPEQLEPVKGKWGPPFGNATATLTVVHRQALESDVLRVATELRFGAKLPTNNVGDSYFYQKGRLADAAYWLVEHFEAGSNAVCLTYTNKARKGINLLARKHLGFLNKGKIVVGERLVVKFNNKAAGKRNGETFDVQSLTDISGAVRLVTTTGAVLYAHPDLIGADIATFKETRDKYALLTNTRLWVHIDYGYCLTVHSAQGSEYEHVMLALTGTMKWMVQNKKMKVTSARRLCYTALTRAKSTFTRLDA